MSNREWQMVGSVTHHVFIYSEECFEISPAELFVHTFDWWPHDPLITINYQLIKGAYFNNGKLKIVFL